MHEQPANPAAQPPLRLIRLPEVTHLTSLSRASIYRQAKAGTFPAPRKIGDRAAAWSLFEVEAWVAARLAA